MYFASRMQAGRMLAEQLAPLYRYENCAVLALDDGGVMVGAQIASALHCILTLLPTAKIMLPQEPEAIAGITASGSVIYNDQYFEGESDELRAENFNYIEKEKLAMMHDLNHLQTGDGTVNKKVLHGRNIIVVSEGLKTGFLVDLADAFLKTIEIDSMILAVPFASVKAVDRMHVVADKLFCLNVIPEYLDTNHYYDKQDVPDHETIHKTVENIILQWQ